MKITSPAFQNNEVIPDKYTCDGENISPPLEFWEIPEEAKSLVLICHDPDASKEGGWTHWIVANLSPKTTKINENQKPESGIETTTDFSKNEYGGPCPPSGTHHYIFYLYALHSNIDVRKEDTKNDVEGKMRELILEKAELIGLYQGKN